MTMYELNFSDDFELYVDVYIDDLFTAKGQLLFRRNHGPCLSIEDNEWHYSLKRKKEELKKANSRVKCTHKNDTYILYSNDIHYNIIYPKFIVKANKEYSYSRFYMSIPGILQFFNGARNFHFSDGELRKKIENDFLNISFNYDNKQYLLKISHHFSISRNGSETKISEDAVICVEQSTGNIEFDDAKNLSFKILNFLSLIFGVSLSIKYISLGGDENGTVYSPFYFISRYLESDTIDHPVKTLITHPSYITKKNWSVMLNNFFSKKNKTEFEEVWTRFVSMYSYEGFWEYEILGYTSILDVYSQKLIDEKKTIKIPTRQMKDLKNDLISLINEKTKSILINNKEYNDIIESFCSHIQGFKNTLTPTFKERYLYVMSLVDEEFLSVLNFTDQDFTLLKSIRDAAAHGKPVKIHHGINGDNFNTVHVLLNKLVMLLSCLAFKKLGIPEKDFAKLIVHSHNAIKTNASLDELKLDIYAEEARVVNVDIDTFFNAKNLFSFDFAVLEDKNTGKIKFNDPVLMDMMINFKSISNGIFISDDFCQYVYEFYPSNSYYCVEIINKLYLVYNEEHKSVLNALWISIK
ncbi:hypothetical protein [Dickeya zeae]|uniref:ApeA N-terminal domain-containing protein n=1 Tax=Dickeya zeae TaxID=204042 RepID=A0ABX8VU88_9GAMM|nr:hypothetical protein [Dickeya zeae]QYM91361.1 hypothetical protein FGI21_05430 [Dickeya zeae]